ncbi:MAG: acetyl-CoA carboxylase biotin carboxylase subunit [Actinomycetota bacterium]
MPYITKVLVANRGEIAIRIFRACREMGLPTVAIYSEIDREALHTKFADEAYFLGGRSPSGGYLNIERIVQIALRSGSTGIHPGYGFLAENATFAGSVEASEITWIGPPASVIATMGDKVSARKVAAEAGVASVPGTTDPISGPQAVLEFAEEHGWPVTLKAAFGGGGRGFRVVREASEAASAFESASREAESAFGRPELYIERYLEHPRHIEVQLIGDGYGQIVHLGERDCSLQRRHQKLIEESPSPAVTPELREQICGAAVRIAKAARYSSAGTVEFLLEQTGDPPNFWFLEMNTRLQVEHPVSELVAGVDLAKEMILVAQGHALSFTQQDVAPRGHAIECRINAESAAENFLPHPGLITGYAEPGGPGVRVDSGAVAGTEIPESYDSLIAKLVCWGRDRTEAIARTARALDEFNIKGIPTTIPFHKLAISSDWFAEGAFSTQKIETDLDLSELIEQQGEAAAPVQAPSVRERLVNVEVEGKRYEVTFTEKIDPALSRTKPKPPQVTSAGSGAAGEAVTAPMRGTIVRIQVEVGAEVKAGETIAVLEAMKMENMILCHQDGRVKEIKAAAGDTVSQGAVIALIEDLA